MAMRGNSTSFRGGLLAVLLLALIGPGACAQLGSRARVDDPSLAPYVVTPQDVVDEMFRLAGVGKDDVLYDLGSGDGRIVISAARIYGTRGIGFELDPALVRRSTDDARRAGVSHLVEFRQQDVMNVDCSPATVVTMYLSREANLLLRPRLRAQLRPGARVVSHAFDMGDWQPDMFRRLQDERGQTTSLYLWRIKNAQP